jgi:hypothetical protein
MRSHNHIDQVRQLAGSTQWLALDYEGRVDASIAVHPVGNEAFILWSPRHLSFWKQLSENDAYSSERFEDMDPMTQYNIGNFVRRWYVDVTGKRPGRRRVHTLLVEIDQAIQRA